MRRRPVEPVQLLTFDSLACSVPVRTRHSWVNKARRLLCLGRGQGSPTAEPAPASLDLTAAPAATSAADVAAASDPPGHKLILRGVSGVAACGELVGVLGPSGSGKTTLLAVLAGSAEDLDKRSSLHGAVALDGRPLSSAARRQIAYVAQDDTLLPTLTVEECVRYSAILRCGMSSSSSVALQADVGVTTLLLPGVCCRASACVRLPLGIAAQRHALLCLAWPCHPLALLNAVPDSPPWRSLPCRLHGAGAAEVQAAVRSVLGELGLTHVARTRVGGSSGIRGVSGGERRRWVCNWGTARLACRLQHAMAIRDLGLESFGGLGPMDAVRGHSLRWTPAHRFGSSAHATA